jgi:hypothetical protein
MSVFRRTIDRSGIAIVQMSVLHRADGCIRERFRALARWKTTHVERRNAPLERATRRNPTR